MHTACWPVDMSWYYVKTTENARKFARLYLVYVPSQYNFKKKYPDSRKTYNTSTFAVLYTALAENPTWNSNYVSKWQIIYGILNYVPICLTETNFGKDFARTVGNILTIFCSITHIIHTLLECTQEVCTFPISWSTNRAIVFQYIFMTCIYFRRRGCPRESRSSSWYTSVYTTACMFIVDVKRCLLRRRSKRHWFPVSENYFYTCKWKSMNNAICGGSSDCWS